MEQLDFNKPYGATTHHPRFTETLIRHSSDKTDAGRCEAPYATGYRSRKSAAHRTSFDLILKTFVICSPRQINQQLLQGGSCTVRGHTSTLPEAPKKLDTCKGAKLRTLISKFTEVLLLYKSIGRPNHIWWKTLFFGNGQEKKVPFASYTRPH